MVIFVTHSRISAMKRIVLTLLMSVISIAAVAQMQPDSTFYIISYWEPGENCMYEYYKSEYEIHDGDTTEVTFSRNLQEFKVLSATESSYQLSVDYLDEYSSDPKNNILNQMIIDANGDNRLVFSTDQHGAYLSVDNKDELTAMFVGLVDPMLQYMYEEELKNGGEEAKETMEYTRNMLLELFSNPDYVEEMMVDDLRKLLYFHGTAMKIGETYSGDVQVSSFFPGVDAPVEAHVEIYVDPELSDSYSAVCRSVKTVSSEKLTESVLMFFKNALDSQGMSEKEAAEALVPLIAELSKIKYSMEEYLSVEVHLASGWPKAVYYDRYVVAESEEKSVVKVNSCEYKIVNHQPLE